MLKVENLKKTYDKGTRYANGVLDGVSVDLGDSGFVCILGPSGCGKTTLLNAIGGLDSFDSGTLISSEEKITRSPSRKMERLRNRDFGYIFQNYYLLSEHSAAYNVYLGLHSLNISEKEKAKRVKDALVRVDMYRYKSKNVSELSGGQQQRVAIARAIARRPKVIFADEPTGNLDEANTLNVCSILKEISRESLVVMVTHEENIANFFADRIIRIEDGRIVSDKTEWDNSGMDISSKDTVYAGEYEEQNLSCEELSVRLLTEAKTTPLDLTVIVEGGRVIIKSNDPRVILCTDGSSKPYVAEGKRPVMKRESFSADKKLPLTEKLSSQENASGKSKTSSTAKKKKKALKISILFSEAKRLSSTKKINKIGMGAFTLLLSLMFTFAAASIVSVYRISPEDYITSSSHTLRFGFERGADLSDKRAFLDEYIKNFMVYFDDTGLDFDYIPTMSSALKFNDSTLPQFDKLSISFKAMSITNLSRFDEDTLIYGRIPERYDEIVLDRWVIEQALKGDGILQHTITNPKYFLGKELTASRKSTTFKIVGISDSGEPGCYMSTEAILAIGACGTEVITRSEFIKLCDDASEVPELTGNECIIIKDNVGPSFSNFTPISSYVGSRYSLSVKTIISGVDDSIGAKIIISDETLAPLYRSMIESLVDFYVWCDDVERTYEVLNKKLPEHLHNKLDLSVYNSYAVAYTDYISDTTSKLSTRAIISASIALICIVMLYLMQRSKITENLELVTVYRLLGVGRVNILAIFSIENLLLTLKYALPTVLSVWGLLMLISKLDIPISLALDFPLWAAALTLLAISIIRITVAIFPLMRILSKPPAKLAAKYDM